MDRDAYEQGLADANAEKRIWVDEIKDFVHPDWYLGFRQGVDDALLGEDRARLRRGDYRAGYDVGFSEVRDRLNEKPKGPPGLVTVPR